jgi:hypothetical protein
MSIIAPLEKRQRIHDPLWDREHPITLTAEEIDHLTEPEQRRRNSEICRELALKAFAAEEYAHEQ